MIMFQWFQRLVFGNPVEQLVQRHRAWAEIAKDFLRLFPKCAVCGTTDGVVPHHILPVHFPGGKDVELEWSNLMTLCPRDHLLFGHLGDWKAANPDVRLDAAWMREKMRGRKYADHSVERI